MVPDRVVDPVGNSPVGEMYARTISVGEGVVVPNNPAVPIDGCTDGRAVGDALLMGSTFS